MIADALDSALSQCFDGSCEVIVADDGSSDGSSEFIEQKYGSRVQLYSQPNAGAGAARNLAMKYAKGEYLVFLDSDDRLLPWALQVYDRIISEHDSPAMIMGKPRRFDDYPEPNESADPEPTVRVFKDFFHSRNAMPMLMTDRLVMRRDVSESIGGFSTEILMCEDVDLMFRAGTARGFVVVDHPETFCRREHDAQLSSDIQKTLHGWWFVLNRERRGELPGGRAYRHLRRIALSFQARQAAVQMLKRREFLEGWRFYGRSFPANLRLGRFRFLLAYPALTITKLCFGYPKLDSRLAR